MGGSYLSTVQWKRLWASQHMGRYMAIWEIILKMQQHYHLIFILFELIEVRVRGAFYACVQLKYVWNGEEYVLGYLCSAQTNTLTA